jgi:hypothetical protein
MAQVPTNIRPERAAPFLVVLWVTKSRPVSLYTEWVGGEPDPRELLRPFPPELMTMWPVSTRVNTPRTMTLTSWCLRGGECGCTARGE